MKVGLDWGRNCLQAYNYSIYEEFTFFLQNNCKCAAFALYVDLHLATLLELVIRQLADTL